jgi:hypothetical protein
VNPRELMGFKLADNDCDAIRFAGGAMSHKRYRLEVTSVLRIHTVVSRVPFKLKQNGKQARADASEPPALSVDENIGGQKQRRHDSNPVRVHTVNGMAKSMEKLFLPSTPCIMRLVSTLSLT